MIRLVKGHRSINRVIELHLASYKSKIKRKLETRVVDINSKKEACRYIGVLPRSETYVVPVNQHNLMKLNIDRSFCKTTVFKSLCYF